MIHHNNIRVGILPLYLCIERNGYLLVYYDMRNALKYLKYNDKSVFQFFNFKT